MNLIGDFVTSTKIIPTDHRDFLSPPAPAPATRWEIPAPPGNEKPAGSIGGLIHSL